MPSGYNPSQPQEHAVKRVNPFSRESTKEDPGEINAWVHRPGTAAPGRKSRRRKAASVAKAKKAWWKKEEEKQKKKAQEEEKVFNEMMGRLAVELGLVGETKDWVMRNAAAAAKGAEEEGISVEEWTANKAAWDAFKILDKALEAAEVTGEDDPQVSADGINAINWLRKEEVRQEAVRQEAVRQEAVRQEAVRQEAVTGGGRTPRVAATKKSRRKKSRRKKSRRKKS
jgi:hypothetical protein